MKKKIVFLIYLYCISTCIFAQTTDTVYVSDFGARTYSYENCVGNLQAAIDKCKRSGAKVLVLENGRYDIWPENAIRREYFVSNTSAEEECPSKIKTIGLLLKDIDNLTIEGNGATLMYHGKITTIAIENCKNLTLHNVHIDFERPAVSEMTYTKVSDKEVEVTLHDDTRYEIIDKKISLIGEGWRSNINHCIKYNPDKDLFTYSHDWDVLSKSEAKEIQRNVVRFTTPDRFNPPLGHTLTVRDIIRDQTGMLILESEDITFNDVYIHAMGGMGIVSQYTKNITMKNVKCMPRENSGRILVSSADIMHFSGCKGKIVIDKCYFSGSHDDPINIHGTNLRIVKQVNDNTLQLRFMHRQSYGFNAYFPDDEVAFIKASTMERYATAKIVSAKKISERIIEVQLDRHIPKEIRMNHDCIENITCTPEVEIRDSYFTHTNARGTLVTTPRKVLIENNTYHKTGMSAILIEGDAEGWYESGPVCDVVIRNNTFIDCAYNGGPGDAIIAINPSNTIIDSEHPVHKNILIHNNTFKSFDYPVLFAKSTYNLRFKDNTIIRTNTLEPVSKNQNTFYLNGCKDITIQGTRYEGDVLGRNIKLENMKNKYLIK